jgi:hypothetical protein
VMESCWSESPDKRPTFAQLNHRLRMLLKWSSSLPLS